MKINFSKYDNQILNDLLLRLELNQKQDEYQYVKLIKNNNKKKFVYKSVDEIWEECLYKYDDLEDYMKDEYIDEWVYENDYNEINQYKKEIALGFHLQKDAMVIYYDIEEDDHYNVYTSLKKYLKSNQLKR